MKGVVKHWDLAQGTLARDLDAAVLHKYDNTFLVDIGGVRSMAFNAEGNKAQPQEPLLSFFFRLKPLDFFLRYLAVLPLP